jgi:hypothetical protein
VYLNCTRNEKRKTRTRTFLSFFLSFFVLRGDKVTFPSSWLT